jgi:peptide/nickel transport system ATP-binding protein
MVGLPGRAPSPGRRPRGCSFAPRCEFVVDECTAAFPPVSEVALGHHVRCVRPWSVPSGTSAPALLPSAAGAGADATLTIRDVSASYTGHTVVYDVGLHVEQGECVALVGESGSGKTTLSRSIGGLHHEWAGEILLDGTPLARSSRDRTVEQRMRIQYVFQNPYSSLNPRRTVGDSVARPLIIAGAARSAVTGAVNEMLERVSLSAAYAGRYPDQLSGGERQRVAIARALVSRPDLLVCDEVTSALDVLVQASIVELLADLRRDLGLSMLFVTHNLPLVRAIAQRVAVMSAGRIVELGPTERVLHEPEQDYTRGLLGDTPQVPVYE